jgi:hypothetical protein
MRLRDFFLLGLSLLVLVGISSFLWQFTIAEYLPTPVPANYVPKAVATQVALPGVQVSAEKPTLLHFFNPECPCSRFNLDHVRKLIAKYGNNINIQVVLQVRDSQYNWQALEEDEALGVPYLIDYTGEMAKACGVYSTPQAVLLTPESKLYYRGNYNKARYCSNPDSNYAQMAIDSLIANRPSPQFEAFATKSYGCELPQNQFVYGK